MFLFCFYLMAIWIMQIDADETSAELLENVPQQLIQQVSDELNKIEIKEDISFRKFPFISGIFGEGAGSGSAAGAAGLNIGGKIGGSIGGSIGPNGISGQASGIAEGNLQALLTGKIAGQGWGQGFGFMGLSRAEKLKIIKENAKLDKQDRLRSKLVHREIPKEENDT